VTNVLRFILLKYLIKVRYMGFSSIHFLNELLKARCTVVPLNKKPELNDAVFNSVEKFSPAAGWLRTSDQWDRVIFCESKIKAFRKNYRQTVCPITPLYLLVISVVAEMINRRIQITTSGIF